MQDNNTIDILEFIEDNDVRFIRLQFCDLFGRNRNVSVSFAELERALKEGCSFTSSLVPGYSQTVAEDLVLNPDTSTILTLPWRPHQGSVARVICNISYPDGTTFEGDSRQILINVLEEARKKNIYFEIGTKIEFYLFEMDDDGIPTRKPADEAGFFDLAPIDKGENTRREIILTLEEMGFSIISSHHEKGSGQNEIDFRMSDPLTCADNIQTFKSVVKTIAQRNGFHASFMPKPLNNEPGSGMHILITAFEDDKNIFTAKDGQISKDGEYFAGGVLEELPALTLFANPIVNSYKRIASSFKINESFKWDPDNRNSIIRVPKTPNDFVRLIIRTPDAAANPYLLFALIISAGLKGIKDKINPEDTEVLLPATLLEAIKLTQNNSFVDDVIGSEVKNNFIRYKSGEWNDYMTTVHDWEINKYFNRV